MRVNPVRPKVQSMPQKGAERVYTVNPSAAITTGTNTLVTVTFNEPMWVYAWSATADAGGTAALGNRDGFTINLLRENNAQLVTQESIATALFGPISDKLYLGRPWYVARGEKLKCSVTNVGSASLTPYISFYGVRALSGPKSFGGDRFPIFYANNSGSIASSTTVQQTVSTQFDHDLIVTGISAGAAYAASYPGTAAINGRDGFTYLVQRQNSEPLVTNESLASCLLGLTDKVYLLDNPWIVQRGEILDVKLHNISTHTGTFYFVYHCMARM